jgi:hypothetical protein
MSEVKMLPVQKEIDWAYMVENFKEHLPTNICLKYVDYRDSLEYCMKQVAEAIKKNDFLLSTNKGGLSALLHAVSATTARGCCTL